MFAAIKLTNSALQGSDGVVAGDYAINQYGTFYFTAFNLYARSPGYQAAAIQVIPTVSSLKVPSFSTMGGTLRQNLSDLEPPKSSLCDRRRDRPGLEFPFEHHNLG